MKGNVPAGILVALIGGFLFLLFIGVITVDELKEIFRMVTTI